MLINIHVWSQVSTILQAILCEALPNPSAEYGYEAEPGGLEEVRDAVQLSLDAPTEARPVVVTFCTDGTRSLVVRSCSYDAIRFPSQPLRVSCT